MKKIILFVLFSASVMASEVFHCNLFSDNEYSTDITTIYNVETKVGFVHTEKEVQFALDNTIYHFYYKDTKNDIRMYESKSGSIIGIFNHYKNGVRLVTSTHSFDMVDCKKFTGK